MNNETASDINVEIWKVQQVVKNLEAAKGNGTSMISLMLRPGDQLARVTKMLADEYNTASNIKCRVNRQSVLEAITSAQHRVKLHTKVPPNGLAIFCGRVVTDDGKGKKICIDLEPPRAVAASLYLCDNKFHVEALKQWLV